MEKYLKSIILFCIPLAIISYPLDRYLSSQLKQSNEFTGEFEVWNDIYNGKVNDDLLIYGASTAWVDFSPKILKDSLNVNVYNLGIDGHSFELQYLRHLELLKHNKTPKHIILAMSYATLQKRNDLYLYEQFLPYMLWNKNIENHTKSFGIFSLYDYYLPLIRYAGENNVLKNTLLKQIDPTPYRTKGYKGIDKNWTDDLKNARLELKEYTIIIDEFSQTLFDNFLLQCKNKNIQVTFVYPPEFIEGQNFIKNRDTIITMYQSIAEAHDIPFLDYSKDTICFNKDYFYNAMHLNEKGSELFSKTLSKDLKALESIKQLQN